MKKAALSKENKRFFAAVARSIRRAARSARVTARMHRTPIYIWEHGRVVARRP